MKKYWAFAKIHMLHALNERSSQLVWGFVGLLEMAMFIFLWTGSEKEIISGYTQPQLVGYYFLVFLLDPTLYWHFYGHMDQQIHYGTIALPMLQPANYFLYLYFTELGYRIVRVFYQLIFGALALFILRDSIELNVSFSSFLLSIPTIFLAILINLLIQFGIGCLSFFFTKAQFVRTFSDMIKFVLGGSLMPLEMFPIFLKSIAQYSPYAFMMAFNIKVLNGNLTNSEYLSGLSISFGWCVILGIISFVLWKLGRKTYTFPNN